MVNISIFEGTGEGEIGNLARVEINGELVLTTVQLAEFYGCSVKNIQFNFLAHKENFVEGKHYFKLEGEDLKNFKKMFSDNTASGSQSSFSRLPFVNQYASSLYLWTKRGVARHAKMLNTHTAWEVFELLEDNYFSDKKIADEEPETFSKSELTAEKKIKFLLQAAKITKNAEMRENLIATAANIITK